MEAATKHLHDLQADRQAVILKGKEAYNRYKDLKRNMKQEWKINKRRDKEMRKDIKAMKKAEKLEEREHASELSVLKTNLASYKKEIKNIIKDDKAAAALESKLRIEQEKLQAQLAKAAEEEDRRLSLEDAHREAELAKKALQGDTVQPARSGTEKTLPAREATAKSQEPLRAPTQPDEITSAEDAKPASQNNAKFVDTESTMFYPSLTNRTTT